MGDVLHIHDPHGRSQRLLPWLVNGTLDPVEEAEVRAHMEACGECRADYARECEMRDLVADLPLEADGGWDRLSAKVAQRVPSADRGPFGLRGTRISLGWAIGAQVAVAASLVLAFVAWPQSPTRDDAEYRLLGSSEVRPQGNLIVLFAPDTTEQGMRSALADADARIADGPTASGAYVLSVEPSRQDEALAKLRASSGIVLAEPISSERQP